LSIDDKEYVRENLFNYNGEKVKHYDELEEQACLDMKVHRASILYIVKLLDRLKQIFGNHYNLYYSITESMP
jgi:hypothetical protein